ncbi:MAG: choice-of-anchor tandem repeat NxxGxxAF-containing protein, partial [Gemmatimonas sp.]
DFEPGGLNNHGDMAFGADIGPGVEGVFLRHNGQFAQLGGAGEAAPGGGTFGFAFLGPVDLNDQGDVAFNFLLEPFTPPFGVNAGTYRYSHSTRSVTPIMMPFITPAPGGGTFQGTVFYPTINNRGDVVFPGIVETANGVHTMPPTGEAYIGLGIGIYRSDTRDHISSEVSPGDAAPGGGTFDYAVEPWINNGGDVSFIGHIAGEESVVAGFPPQADLISALGGLYVKTNATGEVRTVVHAGDAAPGGGNFRQVFHDVMNDRGEIAFGGDLTPAPGANESIGVFLYSGGGITAIARPGDPMPGGGALVNASIVGGNVHINNRGDVAFSGVVDTDVDGDGFDDTGLFLWSHGQVSLIARTGTVIPGVGTINELASPQMVVPPAPIATTTSGAINNDRGQIMFQATLGDGRGVFLLATPAN